MIRAVIFDMDGLLINSEPLWQEAEIYCFRSAGINLTPAMCEQTMGLRLNEVIEHWYREKDGKGVPPKEMEEAILCQMEKLISAKGAALEGVVDVLEFFRKRDIPLALASSSCFRLINRVVDQLDIRKYFSVVHSAEKEKYGKPHPDIFIHTAEELGVLPVQCLVFEDSPNGVLAALAARMKVVAIPMQGMGSGKILDAAHIRLRSLKEFDEALFNLLETL